MFFTTSLVTLFVTFCTVGFINARDSTLSIIFHITIVEMTAKITIQAIASKTSVPIIKYAPFLFSCVETSLCYNYQTKRSKQGEPEPRPLLGRQMYCRYTIPTCVPLCSDFILHLPRFTPSEDFGGSVYTTRQMCLVGEVGVEPTMYLTCTIYSRVSSPTRRTHPCCTAVKSC